MIKAEAKKLYSWMKVFSQDALVYHVNSDEEWKEVCEKYPDIKFRGAGHSYNRASLAERVVVLGDSYQYVELIDSINHIYQVGAATTVEEVILALQKDGRRLINSGNFFQQTFVGAAIGTTHGYGKEATLMDQVIAINELCGKVRSVLIKTAELSSYRVRHHSRPLSQIKRQNKKRSYAVLPYSHDTDPLCLIANYLEIKNRRIPQEEYHIRKKPPWYFRAFWKFDDWVSFPRKKLQKAAYHYRLHNVIYTDPLDYDSAYDPMIGIAGKETWRMQWLFQPTFQAYNIALFCKVPDTEKVIKFLIEEGNKLHPSLFKAFLGVRELVGKSDYKRAGNYHGSVNAIDIYSSPRHSHHLQKLQLMAEEKFPSLRRHYGKSFFPENEQDQE